MKKTNDIRVTNLRKLIASNGGVNQFAAKLGYTNGSYMSQMAGDRPIRPVSENTARKIEQQMGLPEFWLDREDVADAPDLSVDSKLVGDAISMTMAAVESGGLQMTPTKIGKLATLVYSDAQVNGEVRPAYIAHLVQLVSDS